MKVESPLPCCWTSERDRSTCTLYEPATRVASRISESIAVTDASRCACATAGTDDYTCAGSKLESTAHGLARNSSSRLATSCNAHATAARRGGVLTQKPLAVVDEDRRGTLIACNAIAHARGVRVGHSLNAAIALCAEMQFLPRQPTAETELLEQLASDCEKYTSFVSVEPPNELLLEVRGSFRLFGGIDGLLERMGADFESRGVTAQLAMTPTPQSALWFSRVARKPIVVKPRELVTTLAKVPVSYLLWPPELELRLARFGVLSVGDLLRLPRAGLARRLGYERFAELDYAIGSPASGATDSSLSAALRRSSPARFRNRNDRLVERDHRGSLWTPRQVPDESSRGYRPCAHRLASSRPADDVGGYWVGGTRERHSARHQADARAAPATRATRTGSGGVDSGRSVAAATRSFA